MPRLPHGKIITVNDLQTARDTVARRSANVPLAFVAALPPDLHDFDFLFPALQEDPHNLLIEAQETRDHLIRLGHTMRDASDRPDDDGDADLAAVLTYVGQFVDHDITLETLSAPLPHLLDANLTPLPLDTIRATIRNSRTATLDLDSVYGHPAPRDGDKMRLGTVTPLNADAIPRLRPPDKDDHHDLPREGRNPDPTFDRAALLGDPRNDENLIIAQLHLAFLRAHNALIDQGKTFDEARKLLRQHYQHIVLYEFLMKVADEDIVKDTIEHGNRVYDAFQEPFFLPLEFSAAAYRFGHSMVRSVYDFNLNFNTTGAPAVPAGLGLLFTFTALSGELGDFDTLPENWIIEWEHFVGTDRPINKARRIDTKLVEPLFALPNLQGVPEQGDGARLAVRNLLRGYLLRLPTGQAVARALQDKLKGMRDIPVLTSQQLERVAAQVPATAAGETQVDVLREAGFLERTPLWFYVLAEAQALANGQHLGPVGSTIVAEVLVGLVRRSEGSILRAPYWRPSLPRAERGAYTLSDLLRLAGVLTHA
jgi:hypothetical protein